MERLNYISRNIMEIKQNIKPFYTEIVKPCAKLLAYAVGGTALGLTAYVGSYYLTGHSDEFLAGMLTMGGFMGGFSICLLNSLDD